MNVIPAKERQPGGLKPGPESRGLRWIVYPGFHRRDDAFFLTDL